MITRATISYIRAVLAEAKMWYKTKMPQNDLAGSAKLINFFDTGIELALSAKDNDLRYLKQVKVRTGEYQYDVADVLIHWMRTKPSYVTPKPQEPPPQELYSDNPECVR